MDDLFVKGSTCSINSDCSVLFSVWPSFLRPRFGSMSSRSGPPPVKFGNPGERLRKKRWNLDELPKFEKNFYNEHPEVVRMGQVNLIFRKIILLWKIWTTINHPSMYVFCFVVLFCVLMSYTVWSGRVSQKKGDHHQRLWLPKSSHCFSPGTVSS